MEQYANSQPQPQQSQSGFGIITVVFVILALIVIYYVFSFLYRRPATSSTTIIDGQRSADTPLTVGTFPIPFEGGEYSVNTWIYVSSFNKNRNTMKHILELKGDYFSTLLIALGAFKNTLAVRTHSKDLVQGFQSGGRGSGSKGSKGSGSKGSGSNDNYNDDSDTTTVTTTEPPSAAASGSLSSEDVDNLFSPMAMDDDLLPPPICDLPEIDLQRWTMVTVILSGRTIDVYIDGKLSRSCTSPSYYKVDPTGIKVQVADRGGFDGYIGATSVGTRAMNPDEIYREYLSGPTGSSLNILTWIKSIFEGAKN